MGDTPRTDALLASKTEPVTAVTEFMRTLERELAAMTAEKMKYRARALHAESQLDELHACLKEAMEWCKPCNYEREPWLRWAKARDSHKPNTALKGANGATAE